MGNLREQERRLRRVNYNCRFEKTRREDEMVFVLSYGMRNVPVCPEAIINGR